MTLAVEEADTLPFDSLPDVEAQKNALTTALTIAQGFTLYFVVSDPAHVRPKLMDEIEERLPEKKIQRIAVTTETRNLLHLLQEQLNEPSSDAVFIHGLENWISGSVNPRSIPFILNLNAARNNFYPLVNCPLVFWVPAFVMSAIAEGAPDFFSVRSGTYTFPLSEAERRDANLELARLEQTQLSGLDLQDRDARIYEAEHLLFEYRSVTNTERNPLDECLLLNSLGSLYQTQGLYDEAERVLTESLEVVRNLNAKSEYNSYLATSLNNLSSIYQCQSRYKESEKMQREALGMYRHALRHDYKGLATSLNNLALLYRVQGRDREAEPLYMESLEIRRNHLPRNHQHIVHSLHNLATLYQAQNRSDESEALYKQALSIVRDSKQQEHPNTALILDGLANLYQYQGRYNEAKQLRLKAISILRRFLPECHPNIASSLNNLALLYQKQGRYEESEALYKEALKAISMGLGNDHPKTKSIVQNLGTLQADKLKQQSGVVLPWSVSSIKRPAAKEEANVKLKPMVLPKPNRSKIKRR